MLCACGCKREVKEGNKFINGHNYGNRSKFKLFSQLCECGCRGLTNPGHRFLVGHSRKGKIKNIPKLCECNCGEYAKSGRRFIKGHSARGRKISNRKRGCYKLKSKPQAKLCECNCGAYASPGKRFICGHHTKLETYRQILRLRKGEKHHQYKNGISAKDQEWKTTIFNRDDFTCQKCGIVLPRRQLRAHHIKPRKEFPDLLYDLTNGMTLCLPCHTTYHNLCRYDPE